MILLDTCAVIWMAQGEPMNEAARAALRDATLAGALYVSTISAWEVGNLVRKKRLVLDRDPEAWFDAVLAIPGVRVSNPDSRVMIRSAFLPDPVPSDPADRILVATARHHAFTLMTRDRRILAFSQAGHLRTIAC